MVDEGELPQDVLVALRANRKIEAIKLLREHRGIGLKDAKHAVEAYVLDHPSVVPENPSRTESGLGRFILLIALAALGYGVYRMLS